MPSQSALDLDPHHGGFNMANTIFLAPTANYIQTTLNGAINSSVQTITLASTANMQAPGYVVIDRTDGTGTATPNSREVVFYTGISSNDLTGCTRAADNSTARSHNSGAIVETMPTVGMWNSLATIVSAALDGSGYLKPIASPASISILQIATRLNLSGASLTGFGLNPTWVALGSYSGPTTAIGGLLIAPTAGTLQFISVVTRTVASVASIVIDVKKNGTSIFSAGALPVIVGGGTFVSTASINTKTIDAGNILQADISGNAAGHITDLTIMGRCA